MSAHMALPDAMSSASVRPAIAVSAPNVRTVATNTASVMTLDADVTGADARAEPLKLAMTSASTAAPAAYRRRNAITTAVRVVPSRVARSIAGFQGLSGIRMDLSGVLMS